MAGVIDNQSVKTTETGGIRGYDVVWPKIARNGGRLMIGTGGRIRRNPHPIERLWAIMHQHVTYSLHCPTQKQVADAILSSLRQNIPK